MAFGIRFAYKTCFSVLIFGIALANVPILIGMMLMAFLGVVLPNHPFDYFYNYVLSKRMNKPKLPKRDTRLKFACTIATIWIGATVFIFASGSTIGGYIVGGSLLVAVFSVAFFDFCIPSVVYNWFSRPVIRNAQNQL